MYPFILFFFYRIGKVAAFQNIQKFYIQLYKAVFLLIKTLVVQSFFNWKEKNLC